MMLYGPGCVCLQPQAITVTPVDASHSNAEPLWVSWGKPTYLNSTQITALKAASALAPYATTFTPVGASGVQFSVTLPAQGVATAVLSGCK